MALALVKLLIVFLIVVATIGVLNPRRAFPVRMVDLSFLITGAIILYLVTQI